MPSVDVLAQLEAALKAGGRNTPIELRWHGWQLERVLGGGGMAFVVEARPGWARYSRPVALKLARRDYAYVFREEGRAVDWPEHPNLVRVDAVGEHDYIHFLVMELLAGEPGDALPDELRRGRPLLELATDLARGLSFLHDRGWLHRDLKPGNTFVARLAGLPPRGKLIDFGLVRDETVDVAGSRTGAANGTAIYQAPERFELDPERRKSTQQTDVFAFGLTLAAFVTGRHLFGDVLRLPAFEHESGMARSVREVERRVTALSGELDAAYPGLGAVVLDCVRLAPERRPWGGSAVLARLEALVPSVAVTSRALEEVPTRLVPGAVRPREGGEVEAGRERVRPGPPAGVGWARGSWAAVALTGAAGATASVAALALGLALGARQEAAPSVGAATRAAAALPASEDPAERGRSDAPVAQAAPAPTPRAGDARVIDGVGTLRWVPSAEGGFWMMEREVTYREFSGRASTRDAADVHLAAGGMTLEEAQAWIAELPRVQGASWALPSNRQWSLAAHAGGASRYAGGDDATAVGWVRENSTGATEPRRGCEKAKNAWGLCDLTGNVAEWTVEGGLRGGSYTTPAADAGIDTLDTRPNTAFARPFVGFRAILVPDGGGA